MKKLIPIILLAFVGIVHGQNINVGAFTTNQIGGGNVYLPFTVFSASFTGAGQTTIGNYSFNILGVSGIGNTPAGFPMNVTVRVNGNVWFTRTSQTWAYTGTPNNYRWIDSGTAPAVVLNNGNNTITIVFENAGSSQIFLYNVNSALITSSVSVAWGTQNGGGGGGGVTQAQLDAAVAQLLQAITDGDTATAQQLLLELQQLQALLQAQITDNANAIAVLQNNLSATSSQLTNTQNSLTTTQGELATAQTMLATQQTELMDAVDRLAIIENAIIALQTENTAQQGEIDNLQTENTAQQGQIDYLLGEQSNQQSQINALKDQLANMDAASNSTVISLQSQVNDMQSQINSLKKKTSGILGGNSWNDVITFMGAGTGLIGAGTGIMNTGQGIIGNKTIFTESVPEGEARPGYFDR